MIKFSKLQGAGNDFVIVDMIKSPQNNLSQLAQQMCDRHFGIGADGLMAVAPSDSTDIQMIYYNSDGSRGEMCGNGIRCFSRFVYEKGIISKEKFTVETLAGIKNISMFTNNGYVESIKVDMGNWSFNTQEIPVDMGKEEMILEPIKIGNRDFKISSVLMGVPHAVVFVDHINSADTIEFGPEIENMDIFPNKINANFVQIIDKAHIKVDTWERGAGKTLACGTGACASVIVAHRLGLIDKNVLVTVMGGELKISINNQRVDMEGGAKFICDGEFYQ